MKKAFVLVMVSVVLLSGCDGSTERTATVPVSSSSGKTATAQPKKKEIKQLTESDVKATLEGYELDVPGIYYEILEERYDSPQRCFEKTRFNGQLKDVEITSLAQYGESDDIYQCTLSATAANDFFYLEDSHILNCEIHTSQGEITVKNLGFAEGQELITKPTVPFELDFWYDTNHEIKFRNPGPLVAGEEHYTVTINRDNVKEIEVYAQTTISDFLNWYRMYLHLADGRTVDITHLKMEYKPSENKPRNEWWDFNKRELIWDLIEE